jgi:hypothetical protein
MTSGLRRLKEAVARGAGEVILSVDEKRDI